MEIELNGTEELGINVPLVVRLEGTNVDKGKKILSDLGLNLITANDMEDGARNVVEAIHS